MPGNLGGIAASGLGYRDGIDRAVSPSGRTRGRTPTVERPEQVADSLALRRFGVNVRRVIAGLGTGEVVTYGEVAREAGYEGAARAVGTLLAREGHDLPWWRVVTSTGRLVPGNETEHAARLRAEGVQVVGTPERVRRLAR
jgi:methylated-DNA-protein-cysteine methyltransferase-like protein